MLNILANTPDLEHTISQLSKNTVFIGSALLIVLIILSVWAVRKNKKKLFKPLYISIAVVAVVVTLIISGATVYLNVRSATGGPVHWHADIEYWACGNELELRDPQGALSNKIGTPTLHEHDDKRIHLEGVPVSLPQDASLGKFMNVIDGEISRNTLIIPLNNDDLYENGEEETDGDGPASPNPHLIEQYITQTKDGKVATFVNGQQCGDQASEVQVFAYQYNEQDKTYRQTKLDDPANYAISHFSEVPPGDCIIFEFAPPMERTNKLCEQYGVRDSDKCLEFGVKPEDTEVCEIREVQ